MGGKDEDELRRYEHLRIRHKATHKLTDSNSVCAECPKIKEKPTIIVASGTRDARVFLRLKISRQMKTKIKATTESMTASSLATAEPTSYYTY